MSLNNSMVSTEMISTVREVRILTPNTFVLRFDRLGMHFLPGQYITLGVHGDTETREYSIYSPTAQDYLEVLIKEVEDGILSKKLKRLQAGDKVRMEGPFGFFTIDGNYANKKYLFLATGTGISPFHSIVNSLPGLNYKLLHGVRYINEGYDKADYDKKRYVLCSSGKEKGDFNGRLTEYLKAYPTQKDVEVYLCAIAR